MTTGKVSNLMDAAVLYIDRIPWLRHVCSILQRDKRVFLMHTEG